MIGWILGIFVGAAVAKGSVFGFCVWMIISVIYLLWRLLK